MTYFISIDLSIPGQSGRWSNYSIVVVVVVIRRRVCAGTRKNIPTGTIRVLKASCRNPRQAFLSSHGAFLFL